MVAKAKCFNVYYIFVLCKGLNTLAHGKSAQAIGLRKKAMFNAP